MIRVSKISKNSKTKKQSEDKYSDGLIWWVCFGIIASFIFDFNIIYGIIGGLLFGPNLSPLFTSEEKIEIKFRTKSKKKKQSKTK